MELLSIRLIAKPLLGAAGSMAETRPPSRSTHGDAHEHRSQVPLPPGRRRRHHQPRLVARRSCGSTCCTSTRRKSDPMGDGLRLRRGVQEPRPRGGEEGPARADDRLAGLVAGRLRPLRRRSSSAWPGTAPAPTASATAAAAAAAASSASRRSTAGRTTSASTRRAACCGRSSRSTASKISWADLMILAGNVALETHGLQDLRLRRRPRRRVGAGPRRVLGPRDEVARRRHALLAGLAGRRRGARRAREGRRQQGAAHRATSRTRWPPCRWA